MRRCGGGAVVTSDATRRDATFAARHRDCDYASRTTNSVLRSLRQALLRVALDVKLPEENEHVQHHPNLHSWHPPVGHVAVEQRKGGMREADAKLQHLTLRDVLLPRDADAERAQEVVRIHNDVDERVDASAEVRVAAAAELAAQEPRPYQEHVVVDVQEAHLLELLAEQHEDGVQQLDVLVGVVQPYKQAKAKSILSEIHRLTPNWIALVAHLSNHLHHGPDVQHNLVHCTHACGAIARR